MAQLNPNFEIDFSDINSYEQIQLINDTQLAKENLLMHRAYKEPSDDEIIRNHFSSFSFVDFCPKLLSSQRAPPIGLGQPYSQQQQLQSTSLSSSSPSSSLRYYELETFSDLFQRINNWLKLNKDWRVVSMETLVYDCTTQFNHLKSSIHSTYLPQNTRGLRLFLSPSKSRFSGPQKIGCINVVPRKLTGSHTTTDGNETPVTYETLDDILQRLNELLLTRPIEGRILSVETITLPMLNGYVNTESNYYVDSRLNLLSQNAYCTGHRNAHAQVELGDPTLQGYNLVDFLRVYYEFGPVMCGLVNLIDFVPRFYTPVSPAEASSGAGNNSNGAGSQPPEGAPNQDNHKRAQSPHAVNSHASAANTATTTATNNNASGTDQQVPTLSAARPSREKIAATESLTRLIRRSLAWFETERKRILRETGGANNKHQGPSTSTDGSGNTSNTSNKAINLKLCNLQVHQKTLLKSQLIQVNYFSDVNKIVNTRAMALGTGSQEQQLLTCSLCSTSIGNCDPISGDWCSHLTDLSQPYQLKFVRLAYIAPVFNKYARPVCPLRALRSNRNRNQATHGGGQASSSAGGARLTNSRQEFADSTSTSSTSEPSSPNSSPFLINSQRRPAQTAAASQAQQGQTDLAHNDESVKTCEQPGDGASKVVSIAPDTAATLATAESTPPATNSNSNYLSSSIMSSGAGINSASGGSSSDSNSSSNSSSSGGGGAPGQLEDEEELRLKEFLLSQGKEEELARQAALEIVRETNERHRKDEEANQLKQIDDRLNDSPIGQLTYRLFAPCQLVKSSSCFSINPVNSSSPLSRRGSVDLNGSGTGSENANPSTLLLGSSSPLCSEKVVSSFGAFFPSLAHDFLHQSGSTASGNIGASTSAGSGGCSNSADQTGGLCNSKSLSQNQSGSRFTTNEFESVDAIKRRMEIYVTTNSMKVVAGETLIVNLSDALSCLSTAIEQTIVKAPFAQRTPSTWVGVYVLYTAVEEPQLPSQLLAQQKLRDLALINEEAGEEDEEQADGKSREKEKAKADEMECYFDDDFKGSLDAPTATGGDEKNQQQQAPTMTTTMLAAKEEFVELLAKSIRIEQNPVDSSLTLYNSAYDRTVALPTPPDNQQGELVKPIEFLGPQADCLWLNESDLIEAAQTSRYYRQQQQQHQGAVVGEFEAAKARKIRKAKKRHDDSQCSIM